MPGFRCQAILFDLDGVLIDAELIYQRHWKNWAKRHRVSFEKIVTIHHGKPAIRTMEIVAPHMDAMTESRRFNEGLEADTDKEGKVAYPGVNEALRRLPADRWAIATSAPGKIARSRLEHLGLPVPPVLVTPDDVQQGKPAPDPYLKAAAGIGFDATDCVVIEDSPKGIDAALAAGAQALALATTQDVGALQKADAICPQFSDLEFARNDSGIRIFWR